MRPPRAVALAGALAALLLTSCAPLGEPPLDPAKVVLRQSDLPQDLRPCPATGPIDSYLKALDRGDRPSHDEMSAAWRLLQQEQAAEAAVAVFAADPAACALEPGSGPGKGAFSLVARFGDAAAAMKAWEKGILGFPAPAGDEQEPGLVQGIATQLGEHSWLVDRTVAGRRLTVACWQNQTLLLFAVTTDLDPDTARKALVAMDGRVG